MWTATKRHAGYVRAATVLALVAVLAACSNPTQNHTSATSPVPASALGGLLLSAGDIDAVMGTHGIVAHPPFTILAQHSNLLPNRNCLGIWQVGESAIYDGSSLTGFRGQDLRQPDTDTWDAMVVQAVVSYPATVAARAFFSESADRWSKCTNHHVNMTVNDQPQRKLFFGNLTKTDTELSMPVTRGANERSCQRVLSVVSNIILDVAACNHDATDQAATIAQKIKDRVGH
jgi:PknH-like extracellular domain